jgi:hypothetical protein
MVRVGDSTGRMSSETRRVARHYDRLDRLLGADRNFYRRFPNRTWRIRRAFPEEVQIMALASRADCGLPSRLAWFVAVVQDRPGLRIEDVVLHDPRRHDHSMRSAPLFQTGRLPFDAQWLVSITAIISVARNAVSLAITGNLAT